MNMYYHVHSLQMMLTANKWADKTLVSLVKHDYKVDMEDWKKLETSNKTFA